MSESPSVKPTRPATNSNLNSIHPATSPNLDLAIIGGGPAALSAALYAGRAGLQVSVFEKEGFGGLLSQISLIENYPGRISSGQELADAMREQAIAVGAQLEYGECSKISYDGHSFDIIVDDKTIFAKTVLVATGSRPKQLNFTPAAPVSYCALCDGSLVSGKRVAVIGGANSAAQEAIYLSKVAQDITIIAHSRMKADDELLQSIRQIPNITVLENIEPAPENLAGFDHIFVYIGKQPNTDFLDPKILDDFGYIITETDTAYPHQTSIPGLFAAGDVRHNSVRQVITAAADGAAAAIEITQFLQTPTQNQPDKV